VLFVGAVHRSGSTLFDLLMGEVDGFFAAGQLTSLWTARYCGCGRSHECRSRWVTYRRGRTDSVTTPDSVKDGPIPYHLRHRGRATAGY
jgi:hypothetical protein